MIPLPEPDLEIGTKLLPYEQRQFHTPGMAAKLGYTDNLRQYVTLDSARAYGDARAVEALERAVALVESRAGPLRTGAYDALIAAAAAIRAILAAGDKP